ncbi:MAG: DUF3793 family protein [Bacilli bacterium]|nr:DUF3793 family protein [Bacilli bacterium]
MFTEKFILEKYNEIKESWEKYLKNKGVKLSSLKKKNGSYTLNALVLIYLYANIKKNISKEEITVFLQNLGYQINDMQQARHLSQQYGWYIISGQRGDSECEKYNVESGEYMLITIKEPYPKFNDKRRAEKLSTNSWNDLKKHYGNRCVSCGSEDKKNNLLYPNSITRLQQGHKDPRKPLTLDNIIPQCQFCNGASKNSFVFDNKGKIVKISDPKFILKSDENIKIDMLKLLMKENIEKAEKILEDLKKQP